MVQTEWGCELKGAGQHGELSLEVKSPAALTLPPGGAHLPVPSLQAPGGTGKGKEGHREALGGDRLQSEISMGFLAVHTPFTEVRKIPNWKQFLRPC